MRKVVSRISTTLGMPVPERIRAARLDASVATLLSWDLLADGAPVDLTDVCGGTLFAPRLFPTRMFPPRMYGSAAIPGATAAVKLRAAEAVGGGGLVELSGRVVSVDDGRVELEVPADALGRPGVYEAEIGVFDDADGTGAPAFVERLHLIVDRSLFGGYGHKQGPPTVADIRLRMRDSGPDENRLLAGDLQFDDAEVAAAIRSTVESWNNAMPPISTKYTTWDFPYRQEWLEGIRAILLASAAAWYRANHLPYQAGGVAVDDTRKADDLDRAAAMLWERFERFTLQTKVALNMRRGYRRVSGPVGW